MNFLTAFAISSLLAALALRVCIAARIEWITAKLIATERLGYPGRQGATTPDETRPPGSR